MNVLGYNTRSRKVLGTLYRCTHTQLNKDNERNKEDWMMRNFGFILVFNDGWVKLQA
jgi:hypothetical protein